MTHEGKVWQLVGEQNNRPGYFVVECVDTGKRAGPMTAEILERIYGMRT